MKNSIYYLLIIFFANFNSIYADQNIEVLVSKFPSVISNYSSLVGSTALKKPVWSRSDMLEVFSINQMTCKENQLLIKNKPVIFLAPEKSGAAYDDYYNRIGKFPQVVYQFHFEVETAGSYLLINHSAIGSYGYLNNELITIISNGIVSKKNSGKQWVNLLKGKNILYLATTPNSFNQLIITAESQIDLVKNEIIKKVSSNTKEDINWVTTNFLPYLGTIKNGIYPHIIFELGRINKMRPYTINDATAAWLRSLIVQNTLDSYEIEKYIYTNFPELYFHFSKNAGDPKNIIWNSFIVTDNTPRTIFLQQLLNDGQKQLAEIYFTQCLDKINSNNEFGPKGNFNSAFYGQRFMSFFRFGRIRDANEILKVTQEKCNPFPLPNYLEGRPDQEDVVTLTQSFDENNAYQIKESIENYDGSPDQLAHLYKNFLGLNNSLVKRNDGAVSLSYLFHTCKNANAKLKKDFEKLCQEKIQGKIEKAKETREIKLTKEIVEQYEVVTPLPEMRLILMEEYFNNGAYLNALAQAHLIYEKYPQLLPKIISKLVLLENISELTSFFRKKIPQNLIKNETKILGAKTTIEKINLPFATKFTKPSLGKLLKAIPLEPTHSQYWNHPQIAGYQPIESHFTKSSILFNGSSYFFNFSLLKNEIDWNYQSESEYKKDSENGPHQKRFITEHSGDQLFIFTNRDYSGKKSVKSFDLKGNLLWDMSDQSISLIEEPICTPIASQGKLFGLSYSNRETINVISYSVYNSSTGKLISRTPISYLPTSYRDQTCRTRGLSWNTYTHDKHFTQDDEFVYGYSGSGIIFKADSNSGNLLWLKGFQKSSVTSEEQFYWHTFGNAPSGYIHNYGETLVSYMPDIQIFTALNKISGEYIWKSMFYKPRFIHAREKTDFLYFSSAPFGNEPILYKINPQNGQIIWQSSTNGLNISGEGDIIGENLYLPSEKSILVFEINSGKLINNIQLNVHPLKIRCSDDNSVLLTANSAFIFLNDGQFSSDLIKEVGPKLKVAKVFEPDAPPLNTLSFENINLETTLKIPETTYTSPDPWKKTQLIKTSKPFHFIMKVRDNLTLFREGYFQKSGLYVPPEIIWFGLYPWYDIFEDTLYISEPGKITASNLFTREILWTYEYERLSPVVRNSWNKVSPVIAATNQYIAFQTENQTIRVLDRATRKLVLEFYSPSIGIIRMDGNYIVTSNGSGPVICYDISQNANIVWTQSYTHYGDLYTENGKLVFVRTNNSTIGFYEMSTGKLIVQATSTYGGEYYIMNRWKFDGNILCAYRALYDTATGKPLDKYQAGFPVVGGGLIGFFKRYGQDGNYIENGKEYVFKTKGRHSDDNYVFSAIKRGNRITFFSFYYIETFEITNDKLVSINYTSIITGRYGNHGDQANMDLFPLDNSLLEIRRDDMYFFRNFDAEFNYEKINSFRVENKRKFHWPFSELYPETEVTDKNWISYFGQKPKQKLSYQAFGDESFAYLKFHLSPNNNKEIKNTLFISADGIAGKISIIWDVNNWNNAQCSFNVNENTESWKEIDVQGHIYLYIKLQLVGAFPNNFKNTLPNFNIELRQMTGNQNDGAYRIGGAYNGVTNQLPWLNYTNDEAQSLKNFSLRTALYENKENFYPQGTDLVIWLNDRRKLKGIENNISLLNNMLAINAKSYCCVNILSALLLEEIQNLKIKNPNLNELSDEFIPKVKEIVVRLNQFAISKGISKEWADYALSFWTFEVFPFKFSYDANRETYTKPYYGVTINSSNRVVLHYNLLSTSINQPYIEWILPGLIPHFPQFKDLNGISLNGFGTQKTGLGKIIFYTPTEAKEFCNRNGISSDPSFKILKDAKDPLKTIENFYYYNGLKYTCFNPEYGFPIINISINLPNIKSPAILKSTGQTAESIMYTLENLPADNNNGLIMIDNYLALSGKSDEGELIKVYGKWLNSLRDNSLSSYNAIRSISDKNQTRKDLLVFIGDIIKESKLPLVAPRKFYLDRRNIIFNKEARSVLGPYFKELDIQPEIKFTPTIDYKTVDSTHRFSEGFEPKKGGTIYLASKITVNDSEKVYLFARAINNYSTSHTSSIFSIWLNNKPIVQNVAYSNYDDYTFFQKVSLNKGDNIILIKIIGIENYDWGNNYSFCVGDVYGAPIPNIELKPVHK